MTAGLEIAISTTNRPGTLLLPEPLRGWALGPESVALCEEGVPRDELDRFYDLAPDSSARGRYSTLLEPVLRCVGCWL